MRIAGILSLLALTAGCSGYLAQDLDEFKAETLSRYPAGSSVEDLQRGLSGRGFKESGSAFKSAPHRPKPLSHCMRKRLAYGFWAGGSRLVCYRAETGKIEEIEIYQLVAGL
ncbi:hypothetical protein [Leisingera sp. ANG59]|uniref:hypothetical protein n=1 Tax=Leisingera sp. ANG59 TaxID=2675221 RepID=UPI001572EF44|nr:hypothetical protein [Leisingera sp. ANG59]NSY37814.1 hypothetical protein [Leisingera sp. ANG59]